jgi:hypothetical protein
MEYFAFFLQIFSSARLSSSPLQDRLLEDLLCVYLAKTSRYLQLHKPSNTVIQPFLDVVFHFVGTPSSSSFSSSSSLLINSLKEVISSSSFTKDTSLFISSLVELTLSPKWLPYFPPQQEMRTLLNWIWVARWSKKNLGSMYLDRYTIVKKLIPGITLTVGSILKKALKTSSSSLEDLVSGLLTVDDEKFEALTQAIGLLKKRKRTEEEGKRAEEGVAEGAAGVFFVDTRRNPTSVGNQEELQRKKVVLNQDDETSLEQELGELIGNLKSTEQEEDDE